MDNIFGIIMFVTIIILTVLCIYFIYNSVSIQSKYIDPNNCAKQVLEFGVSPQTVGNKILSTCGTNGSSLCTFTNIGSLSEAIDVCHQNVDKCNTFSYAPGILPTVGGQPQGVMSIISATDGLSGSTVYDTYSLQIQTNLVK